MSNRGRGELCGCGQRDAKQQSKASTTINRTHAHGAALPSAHRSTTRDRPGQAARTHAPAFTAGPWPRRAPPARWPPWRQPLCLKSDHVSANSPSGTETLFIIHHAATHPRIHAATPSPPSPPSPPVKCSMSALCRVVSLMRVGESQSRACLMPFHAGS